MGAVYTDGGQPHEGVILIDPTTGEAYTAGGGSGGSDFESLLLMDSNNVLFLGRDDGSTPPDLQFYKVSDGSAYTPVGTIVVAGTLPVGAATSGKQDTGNASLSTIATGVGSLTETAPASDTASSGLNGRLQRVAQRLSSLIALLPTALGRTTMSGSLSVAIASDQATLPVLQSNPSGIVTGQAKIAVTNTAVQLGSNALTNGIIITARPTNAGNIFVGSSGVTTTDDGTGNGYRLSPGQSIPFSCLDSNAVWFNGLAGDGLYFAGN